MTQSADIPVTVQNGEIDDSPSARRSVALIGPNEASRRVVAKALAGSGGADVREYLAYPARLPDVSRILNERYDLVILDVDCDESYALAIVEKIASAGASVVMVYSRRNQQELILRCMQAGARDFLPLPPVSDEQLAPAESPLEPPAPIESTVAALPLPAPAPVPVPVPETKFPPASAPLPEFEIPIFRNIAIEPPRKRHFGRWLFAVVPLAAAVGLSIAFLPQIRQVAASRLAHPAPQPTAGSASVPAPAPVEASAAPAPEASTVPADVPAGQPAEGSALPPPAPRAAPVRSTAPAMGDQLSAPSRISGDLKKSAPKDEPAARFGATALDTTAAVPGSAFAARTRVQAATTAISAGVAAGMLVHRADPVYPRMAREAHVGGTVVLAATITRDGVLGGVRIVSGPSMLRQAAIDAVKTWRYRPYKLNNQPIDVDTTISLIFTLDR